MGLYRREGSGAWWYRFRLAGKRYQFSTGEHDRSAAAAAAQRRRLEIEAGPVHTGPESGLANLAALDIERAKAGGASEAQQKTLERDRWSRLIEHFGDIPATEANNFDRVQGYILARRQRGVRGQTIKREVAALRRGMIIAKRRGWIRAVLDEWPPIKTDPPKEAQAGKMHDPDTLRAVVHALPVDVQEGVAFALLTGLRYAELRRVRAEYVERLPIGSATPALLRLPAASTKTRRPRVIGLSETALQILEIRAARLEETPDSFRSARGRMPADYDGGQLFPRVNYRNVLVKACTTAGYRRVITMRDLRATFLTLGLLETGGDVRAAMAAGGHTKEATAFKYQHADLERTTTVSLGAERLLLGGATARGYSDSGVLSGAGETFSLSEGLEGGVDGARTRGLRRDRRTFADNTKEISTGGCRLLQDSTAPREGRATPVAPEVSTEEITRVLAFAALPTPVVVAVVEGWAAATCSSCGRDVEVYDTGGIVACPICTQPLPREAIVYVE
jgi:integrase